MDIHEFEMLAKQYEKLSDAELDEEFQKQLAKAEKDVVKTSHRGGGFWDEMKVKIVQGILRNRDLGSATLGMITSEVLTKLAAAGVDLTQYKLVIAVFIGLVARAVWEVLEDRAKKAAS